MKGVRPVEAAALSSSGPGSLKRTFFLLRLGVAGGVAMPYGRLTAGWEAFLEEGRGPALLRRCLRTASGRSSPTVMVEWSSRSAIADGGVVRQYSTTKQLLPTLVGTVANQEIMWKKV